jgi:hypothetical protein
MRAHSTISMSNGAGTLLSRRERTDPFPYRVPMLTGWDIVPRPKVCAISYHPYPSCPFMWTISGFVESRVILSGITLAAPHDGTA